MKKEKTIKVLSDGTIAKVGMIVKHSMLDNSSKVLTITTGMDVLLNISDNNRSRYGFLKNIRKATPEERKEYYRKLWNK